MKHIILLVQLVISLTYVMADTSQSDPQDEILKLKEITNTLQLTISELNVKIANQNRLIMEHQLSNEVQEYSVLQTQNNLIERALSSMQQRNDQREELLSQIARLETLNQTFLQFVQDQNAEEPVHGFAFYAYLSRNIGPIQESQKIIYDSVVTDTSNAYDRSSGVVTVPFDGVYEIGFTVKAQSRKDATAEIYVNYRKFCSAYIMKVQDFRTESNRVIVALRTGDLVYCKTRDSMNENYFYGNRHMYNNFYVKLLH